MLGARNLSVRAGGRDLLRAVSAEFHGGQLVAVAGPNGAGKTTLLRCLSGELTPTAGQIQFGGKPLAAWRRDALARARAVLPQQSALDFPFSARDVVLMGRLPHATAAAHNNAIADAALAFCDCEKLAARDYTNLSGGEQQRVQTARAVAQIWESTEDSAARFLLLDEPVSMLDLRHQYRLMYNLRGLSARQPIGVVCILHNLNLVAQFADRILILNRGELVACGTPYEVFTEAMLARAFNLSVAVQPHPEDEKIPLLIPRLQTQPE